MKKIVVLGATGSIGRSALQVVEQFPERFEVVGLAAARNLDLLLAQITRHRPRLAAATDYALVGISPVGPLIDPDADGHWIEVSLDRNKIGSFRWMGQNGCAPSVTRRYPFSDIIFHPGRSYFKSSVFWPPGYGILRIF